MGIVSISLNDENMNALDRIQKTYGLTGRSEAVRAAINAALSDADIAETVEIADEAFAVLRERHPRM